MKKVIMSLLILTTVLFGSTKPIDNDQYTFKQVLLATNKTILTSESIHHGNISPFVLDPCFGSGCWDI